MKLFNRKHQHKFPDVLGLPQMEYQELFKKVITNNGFAYYTQKCSGCEETKSRLIFLPLKIEMNHISEYRSEQNHNLPFIVDN